MQQPKPFYRQLFLVLCITLLLAACGGNSRPRRPTPTAGTPGPTQAPTATPVPIPAVLQCKECAEAGMAQANIFVSLLMDRVACREPWGTGVQILQKRSKDGVPVYYLQTPTCKGWVSSRLVQR